MFLALSDVIDAFVVAKKTDLKKKKIRIITGMFWSKTTFPHVWSSNIYTHLSCMMNSFVCLYAFNSLSPSYPLMLTKRSSAALWMWKTSSLNRQRQVELCRASFHRDNAAASLFSAAWHRIKPTERAHTHTQSKSFCKQALI